MKEEDVLTAKMIESGELNRWKELLRMRLTECGWRDQVKLLCRDAIKQGNVEEMTVDQLNAEVTPKARTLVPDAVKIELLTKIKTFLQENTIQESQ
ncbi:transcription and mRNA export factor ENY2-like [Neocloeon triangulifer]|uniref:transcription and mRNA export factor ENY2-like n=1 Tax=Neocloeon triangulifer TaxID=2078957 RepID=UPI00286F10E5|nr:transcription and mRNA export factor ENY2-like [Neocloeon triangulifer]